MSVLEFSHAFYGILQTDHNKKILNIIIYIIKNGLEKANQKPNICNEIPFIT